MADRRSDCGYILIAVLLVLAAATALVVESGRRAIRFASTVNSFRDTEEMGTVMKSGYLLAVNRVTEVLRTAGYVPLRDYTFDETVDGIKVSVTVSDNSARFNVNRIVHGSGIPNPENGDTLRRLLDGLGLDREIAAKLADYIDPDEVSQSSGGERSALNKPLSSLSELRYSMSDADAARLAPHVTVWGEGVVNVNTAAPELLKALDPGMTDSLVGEIVERRKGRPFTTFEEFQKNVAGMDGTPLYIRIKPRISVSSSSFLVTIRAEKDGLVSRADAAFEIAGSSAATRFWKEY